MSRVEIKIPDSEYNTRIEVYYRGELNRSGEVASGQMSASVKLPEGAEINDCEIKLIPWHQGKAMGPGYIYQPEGCVAAPPVFDEPPVEEDDCGERCDGDVSESIDLMSECSSTVVIERSEDREDDEPVVESDDADACDEDANAEMDDSEEDPEEDN